MQDNSDNESTTKSSHNHSDQQATEPKTERGEERQTEDEDYFPVIVKRSDEALRHPDDILENAIVEGLEQLNRPFLSLVLSAMAAGLILGFTVMAVAIVQSQSLHGSAGDFSIRLMAATVYPLGFVLCIMSGTQLFTEHTATAVYPILDRRGSLKSLLRLWLVIICGNLGGAWLSAHFLVAADEVINARAGYQEIGNHLIHFSNGSLFISALLAGWLMALGAWLVMATTPTLSQMMSIYIVTFLIGFGGLHHSIAGSVEILAAYHFDDTLSFQEVIRFIGVAISGNLVGGSIFVALLNYGHIRGTQKSPHGD